MKPKRPKGFGGSKSYGGSKMRFAEPTEAEMADREEYR